MTLPKDPEWGTRESRSSGGPNVSGPLQLASMVEPWAPSDLTCVSRADCTRSLRATSPPYGAADAPPGRSPRKSNGKSSSTTTEQNHGILQPSSGEHRRNAPVRDPDRSSPGRRTTRDLGRVGLVRYGRRVLVEGSMRTDTSAAGSQCRDRTLGELSLCRRRARCAGSWDTQNKKSARPHSCWFRTDSATVF